MNIKTLPSRVARNSDSPIQIIKSELKKENGKMFLHTRLSNISNQACISVLFNVKFFDSFNNQLGEEEYTLSAIDLYITSKNSQSIEPIQLSPDLNNARGLEIKIDTISFENNQIIKLDNENNQFFTEARLSKDESNYIEKVFDKDIIIYGEHLNTNWRCVCGFINMVEDDLCNFCQREKSMVLRDCTKSKLKSLVNDKNEEILPTNTELEEVLKEEDDIYLKEENISIKNRLLKPVLGVLALAIISFGFFSSNKNKAFSQDLAKADKLMEAGNYAQALELYNELNQSRPSQELNDSIKLANELIESNESFKKGENALMNEDYIGAINFFKEVSPKDKKNLDLVSSHKENISNNICQNAKNFIDKKSYDEALNLINGYLAVDPNDKDVGKLKDEIYALKEKQIQAEKEEIRAKEESIKQNEKKAEFNNLANKLKLTESYVTSENANLRHAPSMDGHVLTVLPQGSFVYIYDTVIEGTTRIWCDVYTEDIHTGEIYYGWISNQTIAN